LGRCGATNDFLSTDASFALVCDGVEKDLVLRDRDHENAIGDAREVNDKRPPDDVILSILIPDPI
jgi:hypothetical protein